MIVEADSNHVNLTNVYNLNAIAADIWQYIGQRDFTLSELVAYVCEEYDVDNDSALKDVTALIDNWTALGLVVNDR